MNAAAFHKWPILAMLITMSLAAVGLVDDTLGYALLGISLIVLGMPHGAMDLQLARGLGLLRNRRDWAKFLLGYLGIAFTILGAWYFAPTVTLFAFLMLTAWHWGTAEIAVFENQSGRIALGGLARGGVIVCAPIAFHPIEATAVLNATLGWLQARPISVDYVLYVGMLLALLAIVADIILTMERRGRLKIPAANWSLAESLILPFFFAATPPVAAVGLYFIGVHAWRHCLRLDAEYGSKQSLCLIRRILMQHRQSFLLSIIPVAAMLAVLALSPPQTLLNMTGLYLVLLGCLTAPHALLVSRFDLRPRQICSRQAIGLISQNPSLPLDTYAGSRPTAPHGAGQ